MKARRVRSRVLRACAMSMPTCRRSRRAQSPARKRRAPATAPRFPGNGGRRRYCTLAGAAYAAQASWQLLLPSIVTRALLPSAASAAGRLASTSTVNTAIVLLRALSSPGGSVGCLFPVQLGPFILPAKFQSHRGAAGRDLDWEEPNPNPSGMPCPCPASGGAPCHSEPAHSPLSSLNTCSAGRR